MTIDPPSDLAPLTSFYVNIPSGAVLDLSGNAWPGISGTSSWTFTTADAVQTVTNSEFSKTLGRVLGRPSILPVPGLALKLVLGQMAQELLLNGQKVLPRAALASGYHFKFPELEGALRDLL